MIPPIFLNWSQELKRLARGQAQIPREAYYFLIAAVAILAHRHVLQADFFMDDHPFVEDPELENGTKWLSYTSRWLPFLIWTILHKLHASPEVYHALTLGMHVAVSCLILPVGRDLMKRMFGSHYPESVRQAAVLGALVFACHPLGTETVHYARCLMETLVTLFVLLGTWSALRLATGFHWGWMAALAVSFAGAAVSKNHGVPMLFVNLILVAVVLVPWKRLRFPRRPVRLDRYQLIAVALLSVTAVLVAIPWLRWAWAHLASHPLLLPHTLTQGRVFWEYLGRVVVPLSLSADHYIPWSMGFQDRMAVWATLGAGTFFAIAIWLMLQPRTRIAGLLLGLALAPLLLRFGYVVKELMVEYRVYGALPWFALLAGAGLVWLRDQSRVAGLATTLAILLSFIALSNFRSATWRDEGALAADALRQYPMNMRALTLAQGAAFEAKDYQSVLRLMKKADQALAANEAYNRLRTSRQLELNRVYQHYAVAQQYATYAIAETQGVPAAINYADRVIATMNKRYPGHYLDAKTGEYQKGNALVAARLHLGNLAARSANMDLK